VSESAPEPQQRSRLANSIVRLPKALVQFGDAVGEPVLHRDLDGTSVLSIVAPALADKPVSTLIADTAAAAAASM
jgi:hypothetical protein